MTVELPPANGRGGQRIVDPRIWQRAEQARRDDEQTTLTDEWTNGRAE